MVVRVVHNFCLLYMLHENRRHKDRKLCFSSPLLQKCNMNIRSCSVYINILNNKLTSKLSMLRGPCIFFLPLGDEIGLRSSDFVKEEPRDSLKISCLSCTDCENLPFSITLLDGGVEVSGTGVCTPYMVSKSV